MANGSEPEKQPQVTLIGIALLTMVLGLFTLPPLQDKSEIATVPYSVFKSRIEEGAILEVTLNETTIVGRMIGFKSERRPVTSEITSDAEPD